MEKEFKSGGIVITREDYESMPCPMCATEFSDEQMQELADRIADIMSSQWGYNEYEISCLEEDSDEMEDFNTALWQEMEETAVYMGMRYYEDITD